MAQVIGVRGGMSAAEKVGERGRTTGIERRPGLGMVVGKTAVGGTANGGWIRSRQRSPHWSWPMLRC